MMDVEAPLVTRDLTRVYRRMLGAAGVCALDGLSLRIEPGQVWGLVGPNGSGKTTAIRCALGLLTPTRGGAFLFGAAAGTFAARRRIGFSPEHLALSRKRTGEETLRLLGRLAGVPSAEIARRVDAALALVGLSDARKQTLGRYSKGMVRRLSIAGALQHDPPLLVLDEPFDGLDPLGSAVIRDEIARRAAEGAAVLVSSHALAELESVATHLLVIDRGVTIESGERDQVLARHGLTSLCVRDLSDEAASEIEGVLARHGAALVDRGPARESLEALFRRRIRGRDGDR